MPNQQTLIMKRILPYFLFLTLLFTGLKLTAQDTLIIAPNQMILADILEIGVDEIKYKPYDDPQSPVFVVDKAKVLKIITQEGKEYTFMDGFTDPELYTKQKKNALKFGIFSPLASNLQFSYERSLKPGKSIEFVLGIIGVGFDPEENNPAGAYTKVGIKFISTPDYYMKGMRYSHLLKGWYAKPEIIISAFGRDEFDNYYGETIGRETIIAAAVVVNLGKQWVFNDAFLIDLFLGAGFGFSNNNGDFDRFYGFIGAADSFPIAITGGFKFGFLFY